jgi:hypothetical protein
MEPADAANSKRFRLVREVKLGDLISAGSLMVAAAAFTAGRCADRETERRLHAEAVRSAAIGELESLQRVKQRTDGVFETAQVAVSQSTQRARKDRDTVAIRESVYEAISAARFAATAAIRAESRGVGFVSLYGYSPCAVTAYDSTLSVLRGASDRAMSALVDSVSNLAGVLAARASDPAGALSMRETLRDYIRADKKSYDDAANAIIRPLEEALLPLVRGSDDAIVDHEVGSACPSRTPTSAVTQSK